MKILKDFDINKLPITFFAHTLNFVERDCYDKKCAVIFEAVVKNRIDMFISEKLPSELPEVARDSKYFYELWECFQKGIDNEDFLEKKAIYLSQVSNVEINIFLTSFSKAKEIEKSKNDWWEITVYSPEHFLPEENDFCTLSMPLHTPIEEEFPFDIKPVPQKTEDILYKLYLPYINNKTTGKYMKNENNGMLNAILQGTAFSEIDVFYVGAALACCLVDQTPAPAAYFDMGIESSYSNRKLRRGNPNNYQIMTNATIVSYQTICNHAANVVDVIISHWHTDHVSILNEIAIDYVLGQGATYVNFWSNVNIVCPEVINAKGWAVTYFTAVQGAMQTAGNNNITVIPYVNANQTVPVNLNCNNISVQKCDRNDAGVRNPNHHDHGICALVFTTAGNYVFLAGDCAYDTLSLNNAAAMILNNNGVGYTYLVASHHGGKYTHTTGQNKTNFIPVPNNAPTQHCIFSANGIAYGHPVPANVTAYQNVGWNPDYTHTLPLANTNVINFM